MPTGLCVAKAPNPWPPRSRSLALREPYMPQGFRATGCLALHPPDPRPSPSGQIWPLSQGEPSPTSDERVHPHPLASRSPARPLTAPPASPGRGPAGDPPSPQAFASQGADRGLEGGGTQRTRAGWLPAPRSPTALGAAILPDDASRRGGTSPLNTRFRRYFCGHALLFFLARLLKAHTHFNPVGVFGTPFL